MTYKTCTRMPHRRVIVHNMPHKVLDLGLIHGGTGYDVPSEGWEGAMYDFVRERLQTWLDGRDVNQRLSVLAKQISSAFDSQMTHLFAAIRPNLSVQNTSVRMTEENGRCIAYVVVKCKEAELRWVFNLSL